MTGGLRRYWRSGRGADLCVASASVFFFLLFFGRAFLAGRYLVAADAYFYSYPLRTVAWEQIRDGVLPLWTPHILSGYPMLSMAQLGLGYPVTWFYLFLSGHAAEQVYVLAPFVLAPVFTYAFCREQGRGRAASLLAGLAFTYGGMMTSKLSVVGMATNSVAWLPLVLTFVERARTRTLARCLPWAALAYSMSVLNGQGQHFLYTGILAVAYAAFISATEALAARRHDETTHDDKATRGDETNRDARREITTGAESRHEATQREARQGEGTQREETQREEARQSETSRFRTWLSSWRPLAVAVGGVGLGAGVAAFQILETLRAARRSVRSRLTYEVFSAGSFTPVGAVESFFAPLYHYIETSAYVAPLAFAAALYACAQLLRPGRRDPRVIFWLIVALVAFLLMTGPATPLNRLAYALPLLNSFRYPSRHAFEWTFAVAVLSSYGFDALSARFAHRAEDSDASRKGGRLFGGSPVSLLLAASAAAVGALWWRAAERAPALLSAPDTGMGTGLPESSYLLWKLCFTLLAFAAAWLALRARRGRARGVALLAVVLVACFVEPFISVSRWWYTDAKHASHFATVSPAARLLAQFPPAQNRVYTRVNLYLKDYPPAPPPLELPNLTALRGLQNVAGYEQLILERYSRALGNVGPDAVNPRYDVQGKPDPTLFQARSRVLDLLNATHVIAFSNLETAPPQLMERGGLRLSARELDASLAPGESALLSGGAEADALALVTSLANSVEVEHGRAVARLRVTTDDGRALELPLRAGLDTSEWAHERADVRPVIRHGLAPVFDGTPGDPANSFTSHRYLARIPLGGRARVRGVEIVNTDPRASIALWKASLFDSTTGRSTPLAPAPPDLDTRRWQTVFDQDGVIILRNLDALPRAWLVAEAEAVDGEEALRRIRGETEQSGSETEQVKDESARGLDSSATARAFDPSATARDFDPRRTALLEVTPSELPPLPGGEVAAGSTARVVNYGANSLMVETDAPTATLLVVSEMFYPGWEATVDGRSQPILLTDYLLRGVALPAGKHRVEMRYRAPAARNGAVVSVASLLLICGMAVYARRGRVRGAGRARGGGGA